MEGRRIPLAGIVLAVVSGGIVALSDFGVASIIALVGVWIISFWLVVPPPPPPRQERAEGVQLTRSGMRDLIEHSGLPMLMLDGNRIIVANKAAREAIGTHVTGQDARVALRHPAAVDLLARKEGGSVTVQGLTGPRSNWQMTRQPIDDRYALVELINRTSEADVSRAHTDFVANASHELRTPLASVAGFIETLRGPARDDPAAREKFLQIMQNQTQRMARLIDDLLSLSRLEMKPYQKPSTQLDVVELVKGVMESMRHIAGENDVEFVSELGVKPMLIAGHSDELVQVFENLIENACKYGSDGERVIVSAEQASPMDEVRITVRDFGPGIPEEHIPRITERFYRVDIETSRIQKGTGLGLSIVKHILTRHDARLSVKSAPGEGSSFTVHFPPVPPAG